MSDIRRKVRKITVEFEDGSKSTFSGTEGYLVRGTTQVPVEGKLQPQWPTVDNVTVHLKIRDSRDDAVTPSDPPKSIPENDEVANGIDD